MKSTKAASRYAKALLELAIENNKVDAIAKDMQHLATVCAENPDFIKFLNSPVVRADKKISIFGEIFGQFDQITTLFVNLIFTNRREFLFAEIALSFNDQMKTYKGIVPMTITSASPLAASTKESILSKIRGSVKGELEITEEIDPELIGGFIVRMGDTQIDASISNQLNNLKQRLTK